MKNSDSKSHWRAPLNHLLRDPPKYYATHSAYALECNPWTPRSDIEAALMFRGVIVSAFANIETNIGFLSLRLSYHPECKDIRDSFPHGIDKKISFIRNVFKQKSFTPYSNLANSFLNKFDKNLPIRHMAAHASMRVLSGSAEFHDFPKATIPGVVDTRRNNIILTELEKIAWQSAKLSRVGYRLLSKLEATGLLPIIPER